MYYKKGMRIHLKAILVTGYIETKKEVKLLYNKTHWG